VTTIVSNPVNIAEYAGRADLLVGAVLVPGARAPRLISREMVQNMAPGAVVVDVAIDQGGCIETIDRVTSHTDPTYLECGVVHYAVPNIPAAVGRTSTMALTNATLPYVLELATKGINVLEGSITNQCVAEALSEFLN
jgi:alanine dehydrogenase